MRTTKSNPEPDSYRPVSYFRNKYGVSAQCLRQWHVAGFVRAIRMGGDRGKRTYLVSDINERFNLPRSERRPCVIYARVSSSKQAPDLRRQVEELRQEYPEHERVYQDIASGVNLRRKSLSALLERVYEGSVGQVVVMHRDRLARVGIELLEQIFERFGV